MGILEANPTVLETSIHLMKLLGYEGLYSEQCGCTFDDVAPCYDDRIHSCKAGYIIRYDKDNSCPCGDGCDFHIVATKAEKL